MSELVKIHNLSVPVVDSGLDAVQDALARSAYVRPFGVGDLALFGGAAASSAILGRAAAARFPQGVDKDAYFNIPLVPGLWLEGICGVTLLVSGDNATAANVLWSLTCKGVAPGEDMSLGTSLVSAQRSMPASSVNLLLQHDEVISDSWDVNEDDVLFRVRVRRQGTNSLDKYLGVVDLYGGLVHYRPQIYSQ